jgi:hypothetical protein
LKETVALLEQYEELEQRFKKLSEELWILFANLYKLIIIWSWRWFPITHQVDVSSAL